jgi:ParB-like chromosome segregation protein Spo0J
MIASGEVRYHDALEHLMVPIDTVTQHPDNYNNGDVEELAVSIEVNGMYRPIYVQQSSQYILAGNTTWAACKMLRAEIIPVVPLDVNDITADRILSADNAIAGLARPDDGMLLTLLERLAANDALTGSGHGLDDIERLRAIVEIPFEPFPEVPPVINAAHKCPECGYEWNGSAIQP